MKPSERKSKPKQNLLSDREAYQQTAGWISRQKTSRLPADGEVFLLTSPFIEPAISKIFGGGHACTRRAIQCPPEKLNEFIDTLNGYWKDYQ
jgi:hypothetical protein